jgi:hypothetical protein
VKRIKVGGIYYSVSRKKFEDPDQIVDISEYLTYIHLNRYTSTSVRWHGVWFGILTIFNKNHSWKLSDEVLFHLSKGLVDVLFTNGDLRKSPEHIAVGSTYYCVRYTEPKEVQKYFSEWCKKVEDAPFGVMSRSISAILINNIQNTEAQWVTLWHEVIHAIAFDRQIDLSEEVVESVAQSIVQIIVDNPALIFPVDKSSKSVV